MKTQNLSPTVLLVLVIVIAFGLPVLLGYSLLAQYVAPSVFPSGIYSEFVRSPSGALTIDPVASAQIFPWNKLVGDSIKTGHLPLWNPYSLTGVPLLANIQSAAFFPIQLLQDLAPSHLWSCFYIFRFCIAGFFTFLFFRRLDLDGLPSAAGAVFFMLAGGTTLYFRLEPAFNSAVALPMVLYFFERLSGEPSRKNLVLASLSFACLLVSGQPEVTALNALFLVSYSAFRCWQHGAAGVPRSRALVPLALYPAGALLAMPFLLPVLEYLSWTGPDQREAFGKIALSPRIMVLQIAPYLLGGVHDYVTPQARTVFSWNLIGGYTGIVGVYLVVLAALSKTRLRFSGVSGFWMIAATTVFLKIYGLPPVQWLAGMPILNRFYYTRYSGPILAISLAGLAAVGAQAFPNREDARARSIALLLTALLALLLVWPASGLLALHGTYTEVVVALVPLIIPLCFLTIIALLVLRTRTGQDALVMPVLLSAELMILVPSGLRGTEELLRVTSIVLFVVMLFCLRRKAWYSATILVAASLASLIVSHRGLPSARSAGTGLPKAADLFAEPRFVSFLKERQSRDYGRTYSLDGFLNGNYSAAFGIYGLNICEGLIPSNIRAFASKYLDPGVNPVYLDGASAFRTSGSAREALRAYKKYYDFIGVKSVVASPSQGAMSESQRRSFPERKQNVAVGFTPGARFTAKLRLEPDELSGIKVLMATYARTNSGTIVLRVQDAGGAVLATGDLQASRLIDNEYAEFRFDPVRLNRGTDVTLEWEYLGGAAGDAVAFWCEPDMNTGFELEGASQYSGVLPYIIQQSDNGFIQVHDGETRIWENPAAFPRAFFVPNVAVARNTSDALEMLQSMNLRKDAVITARQPDLALTGRTTNVAVEVRITEMEANRLVVSVDGAQKGLLVMTDTYYPGWVASVDGKSRPVYETDAAFRGVFLEEGDKKVLLEYRPWSFMIGMIIALATLLCCVFPWHRLRLNL